MTERIVMGESIAEVAAIAAKLTSNQRRAMLEAGTSAGGDLAPYCGSYRRAGYVMTMMTAVPAKLFVKVPKPRAKAWHYAFTPLGIAVRNHLISQGADHDR